jgi:hypothetical protein
MGNLTRCLTIAPSSEFTKAAHTAAKAIGMMEQGVMLVVTAVIEKTQ